MAFFMRLGLVAAVIGLLSASRAAEPADAGEQPVAVNELTKGLMAALGDSFEFLGGEVGRTETSIPSRAAGRFWFARVRPRKSGEFAITYTVRFNSPSNLSKETQLPDRAEYLVPIKVGERGAPRVVHAGQSGGSTYPPANVGDTLLIPIHVDRYRIGHTFATPDKEDSGAKGFFNRYTHEEYMKLAAARPVVHNETAGRLQLLASWGTSLSDRAGTRNFHSLTAYLEFTKSGEFNLAGRLADAGATGEDGGSAFRVVARDEPITTLLGSVFYQEQRGSSRSGWLGTIGRGTHEMRIGDRVLIECGEYPAAPMEPVKAYRPGVVVLQPFKAIAPYTPESKTGGSESVAVP
jgi:hypothetical protein